MLQRLTLGLFLLVLCGVTQEAQGAWVIARDNGGTIGDYVNRYRMVRASGQSVVIDGPCVSACTIVLSAIPHDKICVTPSARFGFHQAFNRSQAMSGEEIRVPNRVASNLLLAMYPPHIRAWIRGRNGLPPPHKLLWLEGRQLMAMYRLCSPGAGADY